ncbi:MAG: SAM-dependent methyltransferase [Acidobacteria bacterium]|nr:SAM-dependent methyltransferase [Acidobacteriota bacterium]
MPIGLTVVSLPRREGHRLRVHGVDLLNGTPVLDITPHYLQRARAGTAPRMGGRMTIRACVSSASVAGERTPPRGAFVPRSGWLVPVSMPLIPAA